MKHKPPERMKPSTPLKQAIGQYLVEVGGKKKKRALEVEVKKSI